MHRPLCRGKKLKPIPGGSRERPGNQLLAGRRRWRRSICNRIENFSKVILKTRRRDQKQALRGHIAGILERMRNAAGKIGKVAGPCSDCIPANLNLQRAFEDVEGFVLPVVNVRRRPSPGRTDISDRKKVSPVSLPVAMNFIRFPGSQ